MLANKLWDLLMQDANNIRPMEVLLEQEWKQLGTRQKKHFRTKDSHMLLYAAIFRKSRPALALLLGYDVVVSPIKSLYKVLPLPLHFAVETRQELLVQELLKYSANLNQLNESGMAPLHISAKNSDVPITRLLLEKGANIGQPDRCEKRLPLHYAAWAAPKNDLSVIQLLLEYGAKVDQCDKKNMFPLDIAVEKKDLAFLELLIQYGADVNQRGFYGFLPLQLAIMPGKPVSVPQTVTKIVTFLISHGADPYLPNSRASYTWMNTALQQIAHQARIDYLKKQTCLPKHWSNEVLGSLARLYHNPIVKRWRKNGASIYALQVLLPAKATQADQSFLSNLARLPTEILNKITLYLELPKLIATCTEPYEEIIPSHMEKIQAYCDAIFKKRKNCSA